MPCVDLRAAVSGALDVTVPDLVFENVRRRVARQRFAQAQQRIRSMLAAATLFVIAALFAGGAAGAVNAAPYVASAPAPAPVPLST